MTDKALHITLEDSKTIHKDFIRKETGEIVIHQINFARATMKEAQEFKDLLMYDILTNKRKIIIDLSHCEFIDSTFLGVLVVVLKKMETKAGEIKFVRPKESAYYLFKITGLYELLNFYIDIEKAIQSFN